MCAGLRMSAQSAPRAVPPTATMSAPESALASMTAARSVQLPEGVEMVMPGDSVTVDVELIAPVALEAGSRFAIREGGHTVGAGVVTEIGRAHV